MTTRTKLTTTVFAAITLALVSNSANATDYRHLDRIAVRIVKNSEALFREFRIHYRHSSEYRHLIDDVKELRSHAIHIHDVAHHRGSLAHLASDVREMDRLFHHLENVVERVEHNSHHGYHSGHVHGRTNHVASLLHAIESDLHHLGEDVGAVALPRTSGYGRRVRTPIAVPGTCALPSRSLRVPVPGPPVRVVPSISSRNFGPRGFGSHGRASIPTPFGRLTIHH